MERSHPQEVATNRLGQHRPLRHTEVRANQRLPEVQANHARNTSVPPRRRLPGNKQLGIQMGGDESHARRPVETKLQRRRQKLQRFSKLGLHYSKRWYSAQMLPLRRNRPQSRSVPRPRKAQILGTQARSPHGARRPSRKESSAESTTKPTSSLEGKPRKRRRHVRHPKTA